MNIKVIGCELTKEQMREYEKQAVEDYGIGEIETVEIKIIRPFIQVRYIRYSQQSDDYYALLEEMEPTIIKR